jgi:hypothetical protein
MQRERLKIGVGEERCSITYRLKIERKIEDAAGRIWMSVQVINC